MTIPDNSDRPGARIPCETRNVFGFSVAVSSVEEMSVALAERALEAEAPFLVAAADAHVVTLGVHDRDYGNVLERMDVICPDGMPVVWRLNRGLQRELLPPAVYVGVGAAFAFHAGTVKRAPRWMQKNGLEWLYRIYREPGRLLRRYVKHNSLFVWYVLTGR